MYPKYQIYADKGEHSRPPKQDHHDLIAVHNEAQRLRSKGKHCRKSDYYVIELLSDQAEVDYSVTPPVAKKDAVVMCKLMVSGGMVQYD